MKSIQEKMKIYKFLIKINLLYILTTPQAAHVVNFTLSCLQMSFKGKITEVSNIYENKKHRTSVGRFFTSSTWQENLVLKRLQKYIISKVTEISLLTGVHVELIIDDTISEKTKPRSKVLKPIQSAKYYRSHSKEKRVYGHQIAIAILKCGKLTLPYHMSVYDKEIESKIDIAIKIITELKWQVKIKYVLADSWYSSEKVIKAAIEAQFTYVGGLKTNRIIYPFCKKKGIQIEEFASNLRKKFFVLVTVKGKKYYTYRYQGKINGFKNVVVVISYPKDKFGEIKALKAFIWTDVTKTTNEILRIYCNRWPIETYIRNCKSYLGLNGYQIRNKVGINRYLIVVMLSYSYIMSRNKKYSFSKNFRRAQNNVKHNTIEYIYNLGVNNIPISTVLKEFKVA